MVFDKGVEVGKEGGRGTRGAIPNQPTGGGKGKKEGKERGRSVIRGRR